ncbi:hypothetical protein MRX96_013830 [Rhipicephalus microplus]
MTRHSTPGRRRGRLPQLLAPLPFYARTSRASQRTRASWAWPGAATMESELETRVSIPVVFVNRRDLYVIVAVHGVGTRGCACVLGFSFSNLALLKHNAEEPFRGLNPGMRQAVPQVKNAATEVRGDERSGLACRHVAAYGFLRVLPIHCSFKTLVEDVSRRFNSSSLR